MFAIVGVAGFAHLTLGRDWAALGSAIITRETFLCNFFICFGVLYWDAELEA